MVEISANTYLVYNPFSVAEINIDKEAEKLATYFGDMGILDESHMERKGTAGSGRRKRAGSGRNRRNRGRINDSSDDESSSGEEEANPDDGAGSEANFDSDDEIDCDGMDFSHDELIEHSKRSLIMIILSLIYMNEFPLPEDELFEMLKDFGLPQDYKIEVRHGMFGYFVILWHPLIDPFVLSFL